MGVNWALVPPAGERQAQLLQLVRSNGSARVRLLAERLGVSEMTIRRDIDVLAASGLVQKIHGGARLPHPLFDAEPTFDAKKVRQGERKAAIAHAAAEFVAPGMVIGISAGTTTYAFAGLLRSVPGLTIVTNSIPVSDRFGRGVKKHHETVTVLLTGGESTPSRGLVGPMAIAALRRLHLDTFFLGVFGVDGHTGLTAPSLFEAEVDQAFMASAGRTVVLADHTKWGTRGMTTIAPLSAVDVFITDDALDAEARHVLQENVGTLRVVPATHS